MVEVGKQRTERMFPHVDVSVAAGVAKNHYNFQEVRLADPIDLPGEEQTLDQQEPPVPKLRRFPEIKIKIYIKCIKLYIKIK